MSKPSTYRKKLIEVALPLDAINKASVKDKSIRQGHPSTLHIWWARRPLPACRAVLFASLVDDPSNFLPEKEAEEERIRLFRLMEKMILWENTGNENIFKECRKEIEKRIGKELPPILDPFCGGGSIPLEAQRLGLKVYASDLNPVAVLITKSMVEIPPKFAGRGPVNPERLDRQQIGTYKGVEGLAADVEYYGRWIQEEAKKKIGHLYPQLANRKVIAWIWTRTVKCPNPACGIQMPLVHTFELSKKGSKRVFVKPLVDKKKKIVEFDVKVGGDDSVPHGTVSRRGARCVGCDSAVSLDYIRTEGRAKRMQQQLMAIVVEGDKTTFHPPMKEHLVIAKKAEVNLETGLEMELADNPRDIKPPTYGLTKFHDLFTNRQLVALTTFSDLISLAHEKVMKDALKTGFEDDTKSLDEGGTGAKAYADAIAVYLAFAVDRSVNYWSTLTPWGGSFIVQTFNRQSLSIAWDFAEANPFSDSTGNWNGAIDWITKCLRTSIPGRGDAIVQQLDATSTLIQGVKALICTDPPYYHNINYADLSDYFYIWLRRSLSKLFPNLFSTLLTPKATELVAAPARFQGNKELADNHFLTGLSKVFRHIHESTSEHFPVTIFYAVKESEQESDDSDQILSASTGWQTMLEGLVTAGFQINGTWPLRTERDQGVKTGLNVLASSILLVCRPRPIDSPMATRREFASILKKDLPQALLKLQHSNIAPVDLAQAAIGPGMAIFSRFSKVLEADGNKMTVRTALQIINQELDVYLSKQENEVDQETRFCLAWFEQYQYSQGPFGEADVLARAKNTSTQALSNSALVESRGGKVRILRRLELKKDLDLGNIERLSVWLCTQELIRKLEEGGEPEAAKLMLKIGGALSEAAKDLAYRLFSICEKKGWAEEATAYNNLVASWSAIQQKAGMGSVPAGQMRL